jgi:hypothetical protein
VKSENGFSILELLHVELLVFISILMFVVSLMWCADRGDTKRRLAYLKISAVLISIMAIIIGGGFLIGMESVLSTRDFLLAFFMVKAPLVVSMILAFLRAVTLDSGDSHGGDSVSFCKFESIYMLAVFLLLFSAWNIICFYPGG